MTAIIRFVHNAAATFLVGSGGFLIAAFVAFHTSGQPWADGLANAYLWNFALAMALYAFLAVLLVGHGVAGFVAYLRRTRPFLVMDIVDDARTGLLLALAVLLVAGPYIGGVWYFLGWPAAVARLQWAAIPGLILLAWLAYRRRRNRGGAGNGGA